MHTAWTVGDRQVAWLNKTSRNAAMSGGDCKMINDGWQDLLAEPQDRRRWLDKAGVHLGPRRASNRALKRAIPLQPKSLLAKSKGTQIFAHSEYLSETYFPSLNPFAVSSERLLRLPTWESWSIVSSEDWADWLPTKEAIG